MAARTNDPVANAMPADKMRARLAHVREVVAASVGHMPEHRAFITAF